MWALPAKRTSLRYIVGPTAESVFLEIFNVASDSEARRLEELRTSGVPWRKWGPYLSERQWGTVREDYSKDGDAWNYLTHDQARSRAYRWGEDGLGGISDDQQLLCFALALWNGRDPILKERLFGLTNNEGNHGEDVKESGAGRSIPLFETNSEVWLRMYGWALGGTVLGGGMAF